MAPAQPALVLRRWLWGSLATVLAGTMFSGAAWSLRNPRAESGGTLPDLSAAEAAPDFRLTDEEGREFSRSDLEGRVWVAGFIYTRCATMCPAITGRMSALQEAFPGLRLVSFTVDPDGDTPAVLRGYARAHGADPARWRFLSGSSEDLRRAAQDGFRISAVPNPNPSPGDLILHSDRLVLVDGANRIRGTFSSGDPSAMRRLKRQIEALCPSATSRR